MYTPTFEIDSHQSHKKSIRKAIANGKIKHVHVHLVRDHHVTLIESSASADLMGSIPQTVHPHITGDELQSKFIGLGNSPAWDIEGHVPPTFAATQPDISIKGNRPSEDKDHK